MNQVHKGGGEEAAGQKSQVIVFLYCWQEWRWEDECKYDEVFSRKFGPAACSGAFALPWCLGAYIRPIHK